MRFFLGLIYLLAAIGALCLALLLIELAAVLGQGQQVRQAEQRCVVHVDGGA